MKKRNLKILLPVVGVGLVVVSVLVFNDLIAGIGIGIASALIFGPDVTDKRGKTAGIVYSRNRSGSYTKARIKPRNPQTNAQQASRDAHKMLMKAWKRDEVDRVKFNIYAEQHPVPNRMGRMVRLSGINWFVRINRYAMKANPGCALITTPPLEHTVFGELKVVKVTAKKEPESLSVEIAKDGEYGAGIKLQVFATKPVSAGISYAKGFVEIGVFEPADELDLTAAYMGRFGVMPLGEQIFVRVRMISERGERAMGRTGSTIVI
jgi:hypothetical protein